MAETKNKGEEVVNEGKFNSEGQYKLYKRLLLFASAENTAFNQQLGTNVYERNIMFLEEKDESED